MLCKKYVLKRQDDNGNVFDIEIFENFEEAHEQAKKFTERSHKQFYWVSEIKESAP